MITLIDRARSRVSGRGNDRGSIAMVLLVTVIGITLSAIMIPLVITQDHTTRFDSTRSDSLNAAQTGIQVAVGQIRNAVGSGGVGDDARLPCGTIKGTVTSGSTASYYAQIIYYESDPIVNPTTQAMACAPGNGPFDYATQLRTPRFACIISTGTVQNAPVPQASSSCASAVGSYASGNVNGTSKGRTLVTTYVFTTNDTNFAGGEIRIFPNSSGNLYCMDAGSANPAVGTAVKLQPCSTSTPPAAEQTWAYRSDRSIQLLSSVAPPSNGLCIWAVSPHVTGSSVTLHSCAALGSAPVDQQWNVDDNAHLRGDNPDGTNTDGPPGGYCINVTGQGADVPLTIQPCAGSTSDTSQTWVPQPSVGPGAAGASAKNLVDFKFFGSCLDVTGQNVSSTFLILYTCKQNPTPANLTFNQLFRPSPALASDTTQRPVTVEWITTTGGVNYCLKSPQVAGGYPIVRTCPATTPSAPSPYLWTTYRTKKSDGTDLGYDQRYTIVDSASAGTTQPLCLGPGANSDLYLGVYLKVTIAVCDGSTGQKWNADPSTGKSALQNTHEN